MREIKFRVWDNGAKMYQQMSAMMNVHTGHISDLPERHILEQFTGLYDETKWEELTEAEREAWTRSGNMPSEWKGKEIYEGDTFVLLQYGHPVTEPTVVDLADFLGGHYWIVNNGGTPEYLLVGNIHENAPTSV